MKIHVALDSGAFSMFRKVIGSKKVYGGVSQKIAAQRRSNHDYYQSQAYEDYLASYVEFLLANGNKLDYYVALDAMFNAEQTWWATEVMEDCGLKPIPVFHYGEDFKWLKKYMDRYEYICIGGIARGMGAARRMAFLRKVFAMAKAPTWKLHGLGVTNAEIMRAVPWYSVDSFSPLQLSSYGRLVVPAFVIRHGRCVGYDFTKLWLDVRVTRQQAQAPTSVYRTSALYKGMVEEYLQSIGLSLESLTHSGDDEVAESNAKRACANLYAYGMMAQSIAEQRGSLLNLYFSGTVSGAGGTSGMFKRLPEFARYGLKQFRWLCTYFDLSSLELFLDNGFYGGLEVAGWRRPTLRRRPYLLWHPETECLFLSNTLDTLDTDGLVEDVTGIAKFELKAKRLGLYA